MCVICGSRNGSYKVLCDYQRMLVFVKRGILIPAGARCCRTHLYKNQLDFSSLEQIRANQMDQLIFDANSLQDIFNDFRLVLENQKTFDFDDPWSLCNEDYYNITGLQKGTRLTRMKYLSILNSHLHFLDQFDHIVESVVSMRTSNVRSIRVAIAIFCAKMRLGLSKCALATMFHIRNKRTVSRIVHQVTDALMKDFVPAHLGFRHISRETVLKHHQTTMANVLLTDTNHQVVVVMDGTYLYIQKSGHNELQRRTYSVHKHRHLIKPMVITTTVRVLLATS